MRILGVDPGSIVCGYGVIEKQGKNIVLIEYGVIEAAKNQEHLSLRLRTIFQRIEKVIERSLPDELAVESTFYSNNANSLIKLSQARAAAILPAVLREIPMTEYSPKEVKRSVTGNGNAAKEQVQYMVRNTLNIEETPQFFDATDALAVALCHIYKANSAVARPRSWKQFIQENPSRIKNVSTK